MWRSDYDTKARNTSSSGGAAPTSSTGGYGAGYAIGPAPPTFSGPERLVSSLPPFTPSGVFNSMKLPSVAPTLAQSATVPRSASQWRTTSASPRRATASAGHSGPLRATSSPRGTASPAAASNMAPVSPTPLAVSMTSPMTAHTGSGSMRIPSMSPAAASPRMSMTAPSVSLAVPVGSLNGGLLPPNSIVASPVTTSVPAVSVQGGSLRISSRPIATSTASPRRSSGWSSVPVSVTPLAVSTAGATAPTGGAMMMSSMPSPVAPVNLSQSISAAPLSISQSISSALMSSIKQAAATPAKPVVFSPSPNQTLSKPVALTPSFSIDASISKSPAIQAYESLVAPPKPLLESAPNSMETSRQFTAASTSLPAVHGPVPIIEGPQVAPLLPIRGTPLAGTPPPVRETTPLNYHVEASNDEPKASEETGILEAMLPWAFAETTPALPLKEEVLGSPKNSPYLAAFGNAANPWELPALPLGSPLCSQGAPAPALAGAPALGPPVSVQPLLPAVPIVSTLSPAPLLPGASVVVSPQLDSPRQLLSSPALGSPRQLLTTSALALPTLAASLPSSPVGSGLLQPLVQPPIVVVESPASAPLLSMAATVPAVSAPPIIMAEPLVTLGPPPLSPSIVASRPLSSERVAQVPHSLPPPFSTQPPLGGFPLARPVSPVPGLPASPASPRPFLPLVTPELSRHDFPKGLPTSPAPKVPETRPASPSLARPFMPTLRSPPLPPAPPRAISGPLPHPDPGMIPHAANVNLAREVAVREVELRVLRSEVFSKESEAIDLRDRIDGERAKIEDASGEVDVMQAKVGTIAGNRHAVLKASCVQLSGKIGGLQKRLYQSEAELAEKDLEIQILQQAVADDEQKVRRQHEELGDLHMDHAEQGQKARWLAEHQHGLRRKAAIDVWHDNVQAQVQQERDLHALQQKKQAIHEQLDIVSKECVTLHALIPNLEHKCQLHVQGIEAARKHYDELSMQARLNDSASKMGQEVIEEQNRSQLAELEGLKVRLERQRGHNARVISTHQAHSQHEVSSVRHMTELISLTECMREITGVLRESGVKSENDPLQRAVDEEVRLLHHIEDAPVHGQPSPLGGGMLPPFSSIPGAGRSRSASPGPAGREALALASPWSGPGRPRLPSTPRSHSPAAFYQTAPPPMPSGPGWGMPALVAPITIGGADPMLMSPI